MKYIIPYIIFGLPCVCLIVFSLYKMIRDNKRCTEPVEVVCIDVKEIHNPRTKATVYRPIWKFEYMGRIYYIRNDTASNVVIPAVGYTRTYYINPEDPQEYRHKSNWQYLLVATLATLLLVLIIVLSRV